MQEIFSKAIDQQNGYGGFRFIGGTSAVTGTFWAFVVNADVVISQILDDKGNDVTSTFGLTGQTVKAGMFLSMPKGSYASSITLTSGSVIGYKI